MDILSTAEIEKIIEIFLDKYSNKLELLTYEYDDVVRREGERSPKIFIVKDGIFRIGKTDTWKSNVTVAFCWKSHAIAPFSAISSDFPSFFQIKSIPNGFTKSNTMYEIPIEQWNELTENDKILYNLPKSICYDNLMTLINLFSILKGNRKAKTLISKIYAEKHIILNAGIPDTYLADFFGITLDTFRQIMHRLRNE